jgi:hypothetical protein
MSEKTKDIDTQELLTKSHVTAYVDILGWRSITQAGVNDILQKVVIAKEQGRTVTISDLSGQEQLRLSDYAQQISIARRINTSIQELLTDLRPWMVPGPPVGCHSSRNFWENRHATFVRVSDGIFIHSTSYSTITYVVSEVLKRGLKSEVLLRAGLSLGYVEHRDHQCPSDLDSRSHDISLFGTGITTAYCAESSVKGTGVRAIVHPELAKILRLDTEVRDDLLNTRCGNPAKDTIEYRWWRDHRRVGMTDQERDLLTSWSRSDMEDLLTRLRSSDKFAWNREQKGQKAINDTKQVLSTAIEELDSDETDVTFYHRDAAEKES